MKRVPDRRPPSRQAQRATVVNDLHTSWGETERIFAAAAQPKDLWRVDGAAHVDLHSYAPAEYEHHVLGFLAKYLPR